MVGQHVHRVAVIEVYVGGRGVIPRLHQRVELRDQEWQPVVAEQARLAADNFEEAGHVGDALLPALPRLARQAPQPAGAGHEVVEQLPCIALRAQLAMLIQAGDQAFDDLHGPRAEADGFAVLRLAQRQLQRRAPAVGCVERDGHCLRVEPEDFRRGQVVAADGIVRVVDGAQEADQQPDLRLVIEPGRAGEAPRDARHVQGAQERVRIAVGPHQDRVVARAAAASEGAADAVGERIGLVRAGVEGQQLDGAPVAGRLVEAGPGDQALVHPSRDLQPVRVVVPDEPIGRVEDPPGSTR